MVMMNDDFVELNPQGLAALHKIPSESKKTIISNSEKLREYLIEEALKGSDYREANEIIEWVKYGRENT